MKDSRQNIGRKSQQKGKKLEAAVEKFLLLYNIPFHRVENYRCFKCGQVQNSKAKGFPDFFLYSNNLAIECKTGDNQLSDKQKEVKEDMEKAGIRYIICRNNIDKLLEFFKIK